MTSATRWFHIANKADGTIGGFFPAPQEYTKDVPRRGTTEVVAGGPSIHQDFPVEETDRVLTLSGVMKIYLFDRILRPVYEAATVKAEFSDGEHVWDVNIRVLSGPKQSGNVTNWRMELRVCRLIR